MEEDDSILEGANGNVNGDDEYDDSVDPLQLTVEQRQFVCRRLVKDGTHPRLMTKYVVDEETDLPFDGNAMCLFIPKTSTKNSLLDKYGVRAECTIVNGDGDSKKVEKRTYWLCQHKDCVRGEPAGSTTVCVNISGTTTSNATKHLSKKHNLEPPKTKQTKANAQAFNSMVRNASPGFREEPSRFYGNVFGILAAEHAVPFSFFRSHGWNLAMHHTTLPGVPEKMKNYDIRLPILEQYISIREVIKQEIARVKEWHSGVSPFCVMIDMYKNTISKTKFACFRIAWICPFTGDTKQYNIGCIEYNPSLEARKGDRASALLYKYALQVLSEYGLSENDMLTGSCDFGPDVRRCTKLLVTLREWCFGHLEVRAMIEANGCTLDATKTNNKEMRDFISKVRKIAETINKSDNLLKMLQDLTKRKTPVRNQAQHRWTSIINTIFDILLFWTELDEAFHKCGKPLPLDDDDYKILVEIYNVLLDANLVQKESQKTKVPAQTSAFQLLVDQYDNLRTTTKVVMVIPRQKTLNSELMRTSAIEVDEEITRPRSHWKMYPQTQQVRILAKKALDRRYFHRFHPWNSLTHPTRMYGKNGKGNTLHMKDLKFSYVYEMGLLLNPRHGEKALLKTFDLISIGASIRNFVKRPEFVDDSTNVIHHKLVAHHAKAVIGALWEFITEQVSKYYEKNPSKGTEQKSNKRRKVIEGKRRSSYLTSDDEDEGADIDRLVEDDITHPTYLEQAKREVEYFKTFCLAEDTLKLLPTYKTDTITKWFIEPGVVSKWPGLCRVAIALLGMTPGSGGLECDIGGIGDIVSQKRARLQPGMVEAMVMIRLNKTMIQWDSSKITPLTSQWKKKIPNREWITKEAPDDWLHSGADTMEEEEGIQDDKDEL